MVTVNIYEFSTGIEPDRARDGNWLSKGYTGRYMNVTLPGEKVPYALARAIANKLFTAVVPPGNTPALIGRQVPDKNSSGWSAIAVVSRGLDDKGRPLMASRYFCCEGEENLWAVLVFLEEYKVGCGQYPEFDPWLDEEERIGGEFEVEAPESNSLAIGAGESDRRSVLVWSIADCPHLDLHEFHALAESRAANREEPAAWAVGVQSLETPWSFNCILAVSDKAKDHLLQKVEYAPEVPADLDAALLRATIRHFMRGKFGEVTTNQRDRDETDKKSAIEVWLDFLKEGVSDRTWHHFFEEEGATNAIKQNFFTPEMARLLTLRAMVIPETAIAFVEWMERKGARHLWRDSLRLQKYLALEIRARDPDLWEASIVPELSEAIDLLVREYLDNQAQTRVTSEQIGQLLADSDSAWGQMRDKLARHYLNSRDKQVLQSLQAIFKAIAERQKRNEQNHIQPLQIVACFQQLEQGSVESKFFREAFGGGDEYEHPSGIVVVREKTAIEWAAEKAREAAQRTRGSVRDGWDSMQRAQERRWHKSQPQSYSHLARSASSNSNSKTRGNRVGILWYEILILSFVLLIFAIPFIFLYLANNPSSFNPPFVNDLQEKEDEKIATALSTGNRQKTIKYLQELLENHPGKPGDEAEQEIWREAIVRSLCGEEIAGCEVNELDTGSESKYVTHLKKDLTGEGTEWKQLAAAIFEYQTSKRELGEDGILGKETAALLQEDARKIARTLTGVDDFEGREVIAEVVGATIAEFRQKYPENLDTKLQETPEIFSEFFQAEDRKSKRNLELLVVLEIKKILGVSASYGGGIIEGDWDNRKGFAPLKREISEWSAKIDKYAEEKGVRTYTNEDINLNTWQLKRRLQGDLRSQISEAIELQVYDVDSQTRTALSEIIYQVDLRIERNPQIGAIWRRKFSTARTAIIRGEIKEELEISSVSGGESKIPEGARATWIQAIYNYQEANGLTPDGIISPQDENGNPGNTASLLIDRVTRVLTIELEKQLRQQQQQRPVPGGE